MQRKTSINNDLTENHVGSRWFDITNDKKNMYVLDNSVGAAVWKETSGGGSNGVFSSVYEFRDDTITLLMDK